MHCTRKYFRSSLSFCQLQRNVTTVWHCWYRITGNGEVVIHTLMQIHPYTELKTWQLPTKALTLLQSYVRGVYITDSVFVDLRTYHVTIHREHEFRFFDFSKLWIAISLKMFRFFQFSWKLCGILAFVCAGLQTSGALRNGWKKLGISLKLFRQRMPNVFIGVSLKVHWRFSRDRTGAPLRPFSRGKAAHSRITF